MKVLRWHLVPWRRWSGRTWRSLWLKSVLFVTIAFCAAALGVSWVPSLRTPQAVPAFAPTPEGGGSSPAWLAEVLERYPVDFHAVLDEGLPLSPLRTRPLPEGGALARFPWLMQATLALRSLGLPLGTGPLAFFQSELALFRPLGRGVPRAPVEAPPAAPPSETVQPPAPATKPVHAPSAPLVAIYHTHASEDYVPSAGVSHTYGSKAGIVTVGETLVRALAERGVSAVQDTTCHDDQKFREAYLRSAETAERLSKANPQLKMLLDVHRDAPVPDPAESRAMTTTEIGGQKVARIYLIVGTDRLGLAHPNWPQNHAFALKLQQKLEALYPGLSRGIKIDTARFNQHLHPRALLVEIGGDQNTLEEAQLGARYLADAIAALLPELD